MANLESRVAALEQEAAKAALPKPHISSASIEKIEMEINEILSRPPSEKTQEEVVASLNAYVLQGKADGKLRHERT